MLSCGRDKMRGKNIRHISHICAEVAEKNYRSKAVNCDDPDIQTIAFIQIQNAIA